MASLHLLSLRWALEALLTEMTYYQYLMQIHSSVPVNYHGKPAALTAPAPSAPTQAPGAAPAGSQHCTALPAVHLPILFRSLPATIQELTPISQQLRSSSTGAARDEISPCRSTVLQISKATRNNTCFILRLRLWKILAGSDVGHCRAALQSCGIAVWDSSMPSTTQPVLRNPHTAERTTLFLSFCDLYDLLGYCAMIFPLERHFGNSSTFFELSFPRVGIWQSSSDS